ncbi:hypothetical protein KKHLCK_09980 [Candidatus Electrothrix laxa]
MVECKLTKGAARPFCCFGEQLDVAQSFLITQDEGHHYLNRKTGVQVVPARRFLMGLF